MGQQVCSYCGGSGRDAITPTQSSCWQCGGLGIEWVQDPVKPAPVPVSPGHSRGGQYRLLPFMQRLLDGLPKWLSVVVAVVGGIVGITLGQAIDPSTSTAMWLFGIGGFLTGFVLLPLMVVLMDFSIQLTMLLVKLALAAAIVGGVLYGLLQLIGR